MAPRPDTDDYLSLFLNDTPMVDLRAPIEFDKGSFPSSVSLPLMTDKERALVGTCYKQKGQDAAIELGHQLVSGKTKEARLEKWLAFTQQHPEGYIYCFRGGLRSRTTQQWIKEAGVEYPLVKGGYKAMRRFLIDELDRLSTTIPLIILGGKTGTGKTHFLTTLENHIDLEGIANHRGSSFGKRVSSQPTQINFENALAIAFLKAHYLGKHKQIILEDEGRLIGRSSMPLRLRNQMLESPIVVLEASIEERTEVSLKDYVIDLRKEHEDADPENGFNNFKTQLLDSLNRIEKRLGSERKKRVESLMLEAFEEQYSDNKLDKHREWIALLLEEYYDPMYEYQLSQKRDRIQFSGNAQAIREWLAESAKSAC